MFTNGLTTKTIMDFNMENFVNKDNFYFRMDKFIIP